jgi:signal peptidase I
MKFLESAFKEILTFVVLAIIIVVPIRLFVAQPFVVEGESMHPTFESADYLIVDEFSYLIGNPHRGDVVIFRYPGNPSVFYIKRIVGLPGETVHINHGVTTSPRLMAQVSPFLNHTLSLKTLPTPRTPRSPWISTL